MLSGGFQLSAWSGATCLVTGGLGFIGSNLARELSQAGARVRVVDALVADHGGRRDHLDGIDIEALLIAPIDDPGVADLLDGADAVFNIAGQVSHRASMRDPLRDLTLNAVAHAGLLERIRAVCPGARIVHTSTRQVYGRPRTTTVDETHAASPVDVNGVAKLAGEQLHLVYASAYGLRATSLRLTNVYGPRQRLTSDELGFLPVFLRRALLDEPIELYGDGTQRRDCLHVADVLAAIGAVAGSEATVGEVLNVGHPHTTSLAEIARLIVDAAGSSAPVRLVAWPSEQAKIDIGSFHTGSARIAALVSWTAQIPLADGIAQTVAFYRAHPEYLAPAA